MRNGESSGTYPPEHQEDSSEGDRLSLRQAFTSLVLPKVKAAIELCSGADLVAKHKDQIIACAEEVRARSGAAGLNIAEEIAVSLIAFLSNTVPRTDSHRDLVLVHLNAIMILGDTDRAVQDHTQTKRDRPLPGLDLIFTNPETASGPLLYSPIFGVVQKAATQDVTPPEGAEKPCHTVAKS